MIPDYLAAQHYARPMVLRIVRSHEDTEDVLQDATIKAITKLDKFRGDCTFNTWYAQIAINMALMRLRKRRPQCEVTEDTLPLPHEQEPDAIAIAIERKERLLAAAAQMTPALKDEFMRYLCGDTALSNAAKSNRFRIREKLRVALEGVV